MDYFAVTDEVYEYITFGMQKHISLASIPGMQERTIITSSLSKTFCVAAVFGTPLEHLIMSCVMVTPILGATLMGFESVGLMYTYTLFFDFLRCMGHSNVEVFPHGMFHSLPILRYLIYTPSYHSLHHIEKNSKFCLFMPLFDLLGGTLNSKSWELQKEISSAKDDQVPDFVFLAHIADVAFSLHLPFVFRSFSLMPFSFKLWLLPLWPVAFVMMFLMWVMSKTFLLSFYNLRGRLHQTWLVTRYGFQSIVSRFDTYSISGIAYGSKGKIFNWYC